MPALPAICDSHSCGAIFPSPISIGNGMHVAIEGIGAGPCPRCGGIGHIADGKYNAIAGNLSAHLSKAADIATLNKLKATIQEALKSRDFKGAKTELQNNTPNWRNVWSLLPEENVGNAIAVYMFLLALIQTAIALYALSTPPTTNNYINQSFELFYESQPRIYLEAPQEETQQENNKFRMRPLTKIIKQHLT